MELRIIHDKNEIENFLKDKNKANYMFHLNDIEDDFWGYSQFYGIYDDNILKSTAILSIKYGTPILLASSYVKEDKYQDALLKEIDKFLPRELYCHLNMGAYKYLNTNRNVVAKEEFYNMKLNKEKFDDFCSDFHSDIEAVKINPSEKENLIHFFENNYPDYMLEEIFLNQELFYGIRKNGEIVSVCGVFSDSKDVIQIGNVVTNIDYRRKGFAERCIYEVIKNCMDMNKEIVLNVLKSNTKAYNLYNKMGFEVIGEFEEVVFE